MFWFFFSLHCKTYGVRFRNSFFFLTPSLSSLVHSSLPTYTPYPTRPGLIDGILPGARFSALPGYVCMYVCMYNVYGCYVRLGGIMMYD
ncbi:hypothetical protein F4861DRAFT_515914 [Xylaria intraflava]|nr:hypothetical protein F4861DRAFT_515914 [Xylaria intraflava]